VGGGLFAGLTTCFFVELRNVTIADNTAGGAGGIRACNAGLRNTVVARNLAALAPDCRFGEGGGSEGFTVIGNSAECTNYFRAPTDRVGNPGDVLDPLLGPLAANGGATETNNPLAGSVLVDGGSPSPAGGPSACEPRDQRGVVRPVDGDGDGTATCDIGAVEQTASAPAAPIPPAAFSASAFAEQREPHFASEGLVFDIGLANTGTVDALSRDRPARVRAEGRAAVTAPSPPGRTVLHSRSTAACCQTSDQNPNDLRRSNSEAQIVQRYVASPTDGTVVGGTVLVDVLVQLEF
jgi:hypothetical protein